ncbi:hypothetical protein BGZ72_004579 [Mortierella alpina]|nr:hypothetical protein BGZ72_004579 [Mortierella alpina]
MTKSKRAFNDPSLHEMVQFIVTPNLVMFAPRIVECMLAIADKRFEIGDRKLVKDPLPLFQEMIASAMANVFMGSEIAKDRAVLEAFVNCTSSFTEIKSQGPLKSFWRTVRARTTYGIFSPLQKHVQTLVHAATPVVQERRRQEAEALE